MALDTTVFTGPYRYELMRAEGISGMDFQPIAGAVFTAPFFGSLKDTMFLDAQIDTRTQGYNYRMDFYTGHSSAIYGSSSPASSVFLTVLPSDEASLLSWAFETPWDNYAFEIWRSDQGGLFNLIGTTTENEYKDEFNIFNGLEYCYKILALGDYGLDMVPAPLLNYSQETCTIPEDNVPPCAPIVSVTNICDEADPDVPADAFINYVTWTIPCSDTDIAYYLVYFSSEPDGQYTEVGRVDDPTMSFQHRPGETIAGCYTVIAVDEIGNQSPPSIEECVKNCPVYELPNAFTPNGDGQNDLFKPYSSRFIETIQFKVFNRWGQLVFQTTDPQINWNGNNSNGKEVSDGVYYYTCEAYEQQNQEPITLSGYIELIRG
jgi:gliding motility-associated-like protein